MCPRYIIRPQFFPLEKGFIIWSSKLSPPRGTFFGSRSVILGEGLCLKSFTRRVGLPNAAFLRTLELGFSLCTLTWPYGKFTLRRIDFSLSDCLWAFYSMHSLTSNILTAHGANRTSPDYILFFWTLFWQWFEVTPSRTLRCFCPLFFYLSTFTKALPSFAFLESPFFFRGGVSPRS